MAIVSSIRANAASEAAASLPTRLRRRSGGDGDPSFFFFEFFDADDPLSQSSCHLSLLITVFSGEDRFAESFSSSSLSSKFVSSNLTLLLRVAAYFLSSNRGGNTIFYKSH